jgi:hypothetical protein
MAIGKHRVPRVSCPWSVVHGVKGFESEVRDQRPDDRGQTTDDRKELN